MAAKFTPIALLLRDLVFRGIQLQLRGDRLRYTPKSAVTTDILARLHEQKPKPLQLLTTEDVEWSDRENELLVAASPGIRAMVYEVKATFADTGGSTIVEVRDHTPMDGANLPEPCPQRVVDLLQPIFRKDPVRARALCDQYMERLAIVTADPDCADRAEDVAFEELRSQVGGP